MKTKTFWYKNKSITVGYEGNIVYFVSIPQYLMMQRMDKFIRDITLEYSAQSNTIIKMFLIDIVIDYYRKIDELKYMCNNMMECNEKLRKQYYELTDKYMRLKQEVIE